MIIRMLMLLALLGATIASDPVRGSEAVDDDLPNEEARERLPSDERGGKQPAASSEDVFVPTEEISEDAAVPFPVDI